jgi:hypothetical protein
MYDVSCLETMKFYFVSSDVLAEVTLRNMVLWGIDVVWSGREVPTLLWKLLPPFSGLRMEAQKRRLCCLLEEMLLGTM